MKFILMPLLLCWPVVTFVLIYWRSLYVINKPLFIIYVAKISKLIACLLTWLWCEVLNSYTFKFISIF